MTALFLWLNAAMYALFGLWCTLNPTQVMSFLGLGVAAPQGRLEFLAVYGGLQMGLAAFFTLGALDPRLSSTAVKLGLCLYAGIVAWRALALIIYGMPDDKGILAVFALEILLLVLACAAWFETRLSPP